MHDADQLPSAPTSEHGPSVRLLVGAAVVAVVTLGVVLRFGLVEPPALAPVDAATRPEASLALLTYRDADRGQCLDVIAPDGQVREVRCAVEGAGPLVGWDERGILIISFRPASERVEAIDPVTGAVRPLPELDPRDITMRWSSTWVESDRAGGTLVVRAEGGQVLWRVEAPDNYRISSTATDPATGMVALLDSAGRLLVLPPAAEAPRVWVEDVGAEYGELVWEGTTVDAD